MNFSPFDEPSLLAVAKLSLNAQIFLGLVITLAISCVTFSNWRFGLKVAFVMVLFEGAVRKWAVPGSQELAYFIKDIFLVGAYLRFFFFPDPELRSWKLRGPFGFIALACAIVSFSAFNPNIGSPILAIYSLKIYLFYIPIAFMVPFLFRTQEELRIGLFRYAMLATPICLLGVAQYAAPGASFLNVTAAGDAGIHMGWEGSRTRVTGTFSFISGHVTFLTIFFALHLALLVNRWEKWRWIALLCNLPLLGGNALMSGSRSAIFIMGLTALCFVIGSLFWQLGDGNNTILMLSALGCVFVFVISFFFGEAQHQWIARMNGSRESGETVKFRVMDMATNSVGAAIKDGGLLGYGMGMTHPALDRLRSVLKVAKPKRIPPTYDAEMGQVLLELGVIGWAFWYGLRLVCLWMTAQAFMNQPPGLMKSLMLAILSIQPPYFIMSVVLNHAANFLVFGAFGLVLLTTITPAVQRRFGPRGGGRMANGATYGRGMKSVAMRRHT